MIDMAHKIGKQTFVIDRRVMLRAGACIVGPLEKEGPLGDYFDQKAEEDFGEAPGKRERRGLWKRHTES